MYTWPFGCGSNLQRPVHNWPFGCGSDALSPPPSLSLHMTRVRTAPPPCALLAPPLLALPAHCVERGWLCGTGFAGHLCGVPAAHPPPGPCQLASPCCPCGAAQGWPRANQHPPTTSLLTKQEQTLLTFVQRSPCNSLVCVGRRGRLKDSACVCVFAAPVRCHWAAGTPRTATRSRLGKRVRSTRTDLFLGPARQNSWGRP